VSAKPLLTKSALVTGGSRGIGRAVVERLARDGAVVTFSYLRDSEAAAEVVRSVKEAGGEAWSLKSDQAEPDDVRRHYDAAESNGGGLDIVVNNAALGLSGLLAETSDDDFDRVMATNVKGVFVSLPSCPCVKQHGVYAMTAASSTFLP
jgi:3-oxoacyl-[acyl-carrier protein] reductase